MWIRAMLEDRQLYSYHYVFIANIYRLLTETQ